MITSQETRRCHLDTLQLAHTIIDTIVDKKGSDIILLDVREQSIFAEYFILCNGENSRQLKALAEYIRQDAKDAGMIEMHKVEGDAESGWILVDIDGVIVHIFAPDKRAFYNLEELWNESPIILRIQ